MDITLLLIQLGKTAIGITVGLVTLFLLFKNSLLMKVGSIIVALVLTVGNVVRFSSVGLFGDTATLIITVSLSVISLYLINRIIKRPLATAIHSIEELAEGNLEQTLEQTNSKNELGVLSRAVMAPQTNLRKVTSEIDENTAHLIDTSYHIKQMSERLSEWVVSQADSALEISSAMGIMQENIIHNTNNAQQTTGRTQEAQSGMQGVKESSQQAAQAQALINQKIEVINSIAEQTNILALNAAVEAARAGEIMQLTGRAKGLSDKAGSSLEAIIPKIDSTVVLMEEIAGTSQEQNEGTELVNRAMQQLNQVAQENTSASRDLAQTSLELTNQAERLKETIAYFKQKK